MKEHTNLFIRVLVCDSPIFKIASFDHGVIIIGGRKESNQTNCQNCKKFSDIYS
jgi:hypothetical protein